MALDAQLSAPTSSADHPTRPSSVVAARRARRARRLPIALTTLVVIIGVLLTAVLAVSSRVSYDNSEKRLTTLQNQLTASALGITQVDFERTLGHVLDIASHSPNPTDAFRATMGPLVGTRRQFVIADLRSVTGDRVVELGRLGAKPIVRVDSRAVVGYFKAAAATSSLVVERVVAQGQQRLSYFLSVPYDRGKLVVAAAQQLPTNKRIMIKPRSPDADLNIALYFGKTTASAALLETNASHLPLTGFVSTTTAPLGTTVLTIVASPKGSLTGTWPEFAPLGILIIGLAVTLMLAEMTSRLDRRRVGAEALAEENRALYREQREISESLQRALLHKNLPEIPGVELGALYLPGSAGLEVGGDWYSAMEVDDHRFAIVVGDVSGRGVSAATVMASMRYTIRAYASLACEPHVILEMAGQEIDLDRDGHFATVLVGLADVSAHTITLASAGHFSPLLIDGDGCRYLDLAHGRPLGVGQSAYASTTIPVPRGATLIGFTDGLVERREFTLDDGLEMLQRAASSTPTPEVNGLLHHIVTSMTSPTNADDVAILGIRWLD